MNWKLFCLLFITIVVVLTGCGQETPVPPTIISSISSVPPDEEALGSGVIFPSQIDESMVNRTVRVRGEITFVNQDPGGLAVIITGGGGQVIIRLESNFLATLSDAEKAQYVAGNTITMEGMLVKTPSVLC